MPQETWYDLAVRELNGLTDPAAEMLEEAAAIADETEAGEEGAEPEPSPEALPPAR